MKKQENKSKKPFFARYLEAQDLEAVTGGATAKSPSDKDEYTTMKYPSDGDDNWPTE